jgi:DNA-binding GntR family transcriptional regulator
MGADVSKRLQLVHSGGQEDAGRTSLAQNAYDRIKEDIFEFRMAPGQRYSEQQLADHLGISRTPLRFALHVLAHEGHLQRLDGHSCWQVTPLDLAYYEDLYEFRTSIETLAIRLLCSREPTAALSDLSAFWSVPESKRTADGQRVAQEDETFHRTLVELAGNREMLRTFVQLTERIRIIRRLDFIDPKRIQAAYDEHKAILRTLLARKADRAEMLMKAHIHASRVEIRHITLHRMSLALPARPREGRMQAR